MFYWINQHEGFPMTENLYNKSRRKFINHSLGMIAFTVMHPLLAKTNTEYSLSF